MNKNLHCRVLFYTTLEVYTKFRIVSLEPYGLEVVFGDQQVMVLLVYEEYEDQSFYNAYACAMWMDENTLEIENIHVEFFARYPEEKYDRFRYNLTDEEYDRGIMIMKAFMDAVTE